MSAHDEPTIAATRALDASRLIDARLRHDDRDALSLLYDLTRDLARARDVAELASATATRLFAAFPRATHVTLFLVDGGEPAPAHRHQRDALAPASEPHTVSRTLLARAVSQREALLIADVPSALGESSSVAAARIHATICVPLFGREALLGVLELDNRHPVGTFSERDLEIVALFAEQLAVVLDNTALRERLARAEERLKRDNEWLRESLEATLLADSRAMRDVHRRVELAARERLPLLLLGETGTGKEVVARTVHAAGQRREGPFVAVNCAALPRELVESELFGHARGAFSGAASPRPGLFREAEGGTLFLDEVTEIPVDLQAKLLRALDQGTVRPVGADREVVVDVRIVAATNRDPEADVTSGRFRRDLLYRLDVLRIELPPLRDRVEDVPGLADHFLARYRASARRDVRGIHPGALDALLAHDWPGNVRELKNEIERAAAQTESGQWIRADDLSVRVRGSASRNGVPAAPRVGTETDSGGAARRTGGHRAPLHPPGARPLRRQPHPSRRAPRVLAPGLAAQDGAAGDPGRGATGGLNQPHLAPAVERTFRRDRYGRDRADPRRQAGFRLPEPTGGRHASISREIKRLPDRLALRAEPPRRLHSLPSKAAPERRGRERWVRPRRHGLRVNPVRRESVGRGRRRGFARCSHTVEASPWRAGSRSRRWSAAPRR
ncbi:MAG: sigma 54-interacting transcriptional regulator [Deltaproteobacteria bacterium]|nr:sigma 54-interacting transcriptional regulator [Deltaproteobacteria bacterium]